MPYIKITDGTPELYQLSRLSQDYPNTGKLPRPPRTPKEKYLEWLAAFDIYPFTDEPQPDVAETQRAERDALPTQQPDGSWVRSWAVRDETADELAQRRVDMRTTRARFALNAFAAGLVTDAEAEAWAGATALPQMVTDAFAANIPDATERLAARIEALTAANIHRPHALILMLQTSLSLSDEQVDGLFQ